MNHLRIVVYKNYLQFLPLGGYSGKDLAVLILLIHLLCDCRTCCLPTPFRNAMNRMIHELPDLTL